MAYANKKGTTLALALLALLLIGGLVFFNSKDESGRDNNNDEPVAALELQEGEVQIAGEIECLPLTSGEEADEDQCIKGIKGDDGNFYALNSAEVKYIENTLDIGTEVVAAGKLEAANRNNDESNVFSYYGVLVVRVLEER